MIDNQEDWQKGKKNDGLPCRLFRPSMVLVCQTPVHQIHIIMGTRIQFTLFFLSHLMELSREIPHSCRVPCFSMCPILQL